MTTTTTNELTNGENGRWLGSWQTSKPTGTRGIYRHHQPAVEDINPEHGEVVFHTMSTSVADWADVRGELIRWVSDGEVGYEARMLRVILDDDDGVIGVDKDRVMRTAPLGVVSGAVVGLVTGCPSG